MLPEQLGPPAVPTHELSSTLRSDGGIRSLAPVARVPANPTIYHITHVDNLAGIVEAGCTWSDAKRIRLGLESEIVGMSSIKRRRLEELQVNCHPGTKVGEYVPFYFCPRSIMLYILHMANHPDLSYRGGQRPIVHLQARFRRVAAWADANDVPWAFSDRNAGAYLANFFNDPSKLIQVDWEAVNATDFRPMAIREGKQAEFLVYEAFPWELVERIGVVDGRVAQRVTDAVGKAEHRPLVRVEPGWYY
jgi:hypothetical protein